MKAAQLFGCFKSDVSDAQVDRCFLVPVINIKILHRLFFGWTQVLTCYVTCKQEASWCCLRTCRYFWTRFAAVAVLLMLLSSAVICQAFPGLNQENWNVRLLDSKLNSVWTLHTLWSHCIPWMLPAVAACCVSCGYCNEELHKFVVQTKLYWWSYQAVHEIWHGARQAVARIWTACLILSCWITSCRNKTQVMSSMPTMFWIRCNAAQDFFSCCDVIYLFQPWIHFSTIALTAMSVVRLPSEHFSLPSCGTCSTGWL